MHGKSQYSNPKMSGTFRITMNKHIRFYVTGTLHQAKLKATNMINTLQLTPLEDWSNGLFWSSRSVMSGNKIKFTVVVEHEKDWVKTLNRETNTWVEHKY